MYQLTEDPDLVVNMETGTSIPRGHRLWVEFEEWVSAGNAPKPIPGPTFDQAVSAAISGVQDWIDAVASQNGYDSAVSCASYINSGVQTYRNDAAAIIAWRDAVWVEANAWRNGLGGQLPTPTPTIEQIIAQLPHPNAFGWSAHGQGASTETGEQS